MQASKTYAITPSDERSHAGPLTLECSCDDLPALTDATGSAWPDRELLFSETDKPTAQTNHANCAAHDLDEQLCVAVLNVRTARDENSGSQYDN
jgi:hypothetical protein